MTTRHVRVAPRALNDLIEILHRSYQKFGPRTATRYEALIEQAIKDLRNDVNRHLVQKRSDLRQGLCFYHIKHSNQRNRSKSGRIQKPRHIIAFRLTTSSELHVIRFLHERMRLDDQVFLIEYMPS